MYGALSPTLSADQLLELSRIHAAIARDLRQEAERRREHDAFRRRVAAERRTLEKWGRKGADRVAAGTPFHEAVDAIVAESDRSRMQMEAIIRRHVPAALRRARERRNAGILRMAEAGKDNRTIAGRYGLRPGTVSQIVQAELRRRRVGDTGRDQDQD